MGVWVEGHVGSRMRTIRSSGLLEIRLDHGRVNALDSAGYQELRAAFDDVNSTPSIGVVLMLGNSECFSAGQDIGDASIIRKDPGAYLLTAAESLLAVTQSPAIIVVGVRGFAIGAGLILATCADLLVVDESARLSLPELRYGVTAGVAHTSRWLGSTQAERALLTGMPIDPGLFARAGADVVPSHRVEDTALLLAESIADRDALLIRAAKAAFSASRTEVAKGYREEIAATVEVGGTDFTAPH